MNRIFALGLILILIGCSKSIVPKKIVAQEDLKTNKSPLEVIYGKLESFPNNTQFSIALINDGKVEYLGAKKENNTLNKIQNQEAIFEIGSISKVFTSTLLANFVIEGQLELDDYIDDHLDIKISTHEQITFKSLANHTSGLPRLPSNLDLFVAGVNNPYKNYDDNKLEDYLSESIQLETKPGLQYGYSNLGAGALGYILTKVSQLSYEELLAEKICHKYKLYSTTTIRTRVDKDLVKGLDYSGKETSNWDMNALMGAGGILSSTSDLSKFLLAQFNTDNPEIQLSHQPTFTISEQMDIGLGWHIIKKESGKQWHWHNGGTGGYTSSMALDKHRQSGVIILSNVSALNPNMGEIDKLCFELLASMGTHK